MAMPTGQSTYFDSDYYFGSNPFYTCKQGLAGQCTWYCWGKAKAKAAAYPERNLNVASLPTRGAASWASIATANGYTVSDTPKADSIAVWSGGHVAYVELYDSSTQEVCFSEANWNSSGNPDDTIQVPSGVYQAIKNNVASFGANVTVKSGGTDGEFKTMSLSKFKTRKSGTCKFIYLN